MSAADHETAVRAAIEVLCEDSIETPLAQLLAADPQFDGHIGATFRKLVAEVDALVGLLRQTEQEIEGLQAALREWQECYPEDVFVPPTKEQIKAATDLLVANGFTPDALYAEWGRHIVRCLTEASEQEIERLKRERRPSGGE